MKKVLLVTGLVLSLGTTNVLLAGSAAKCEMPPASKCFMMPKSDQSSRENLTWIGPACCYAADNIKADVSGQNSRASTLSVGGATAQKVGTTTIRYSEKGADTREATVDVTR
jgi:hypothetical protein